MSSLSFPLRIEKGLLKRCDEKQALLALFEIITNTDHGSWSGCESFGTGSLAQPGATLQQGKKIADALNRALEDLGINSYRVQSVTPDPQSNPWSQSYSVELVAADRSGQPLILSLGVSN